MNLAKWLLVSVVILISIFSAVLYYSNKPYSEVKDKIEELKNEKEVISLLGEPKFTFYKGEDNYYIKGWSHKDRDISNKVTVYFPTNIFPEKTDVIVYIYYDNDNKVEDYYVGGS